MNTQSRSATFIRHFIIGGWLFLASSLTAQTGMEDRANRLAGKGHFARAAKVYDELADQSDEPWIVRGAAQCYFLSKDYSRALYWYSRLEASGEAAPTDIKNYAMTCLCLGQFEQAEKLYLDYAKWPGYREEGLRLAGNCRNRDEWMKDSAAFRIHPMAYNSSQNEFSPWPSGDGSLLCIRQTQKRFSVSSVQTGKVFRAMPPQAGKTQVRYQRLSHIPANCRAFSISADRILFSVSGKHGEKIYESKWSSGKTGKAREIALCDGAEMPCLSADGKTLFFSACLPQGQGGKDIWFSKWNGTDWNPPQNAGPAVNSPGDEINPVLHASGALFFASNHWPGLGGFDLFYAQPTGSGEFEPAVNAGYPLNSVFNEFSISFDRNRASGYFASDRSGSKGGTDLFTFLLQCKLIVSVSAKEGDATIPLPGAEITFFDAGRKTLSGRISKAGFSLFLPDWGKEYQLAAAAEGYALKKEKLYTGNANPFEPIQVQLILEPIHKPK